MKGSGPLRLARRIVVTVVGVAVTAVGVVLLAAPGPGFLVIALGFVILGTEYDWARRRAEQARKKAADLADQAAGNRLSAAFTVVFALGVIAAGIVWGIVDTLPFSSWFLAATLMGSGLIILATIVVSLNQARTARAEGRPIPADEEAAARRAAGTTSP